MHKMQTVVINQKIKIKEHQAAEIKKKRCNNSSVYNM